MIVCIYVFPGFVSHSKNAEQRGNILNLSHCAASGMQVLMYPFMYTYTYIYIYTVYTCIYIDINALPVSSLDTPIHSKCMEKFVQTFDWYCIYLYMSTHINITWIKSYTTYRSLLLNVIYLYLFSSMSIYCQC